MPKAARRILKPQAPERAPSLSRSVRQDEGVDFASQKAGLSLDTDGNGHHAVPRSADLLHGHASAAPLETEFIVDPGRLQQLEPEWRALWLSLEDATPFQSPDWILPWWQHYGDGELFAFAFWTDHQLAGLAPLYIYADKSDPTRRIFLLGTGNTDYLDLIIQPQLRPQCWNSLVKEVSVRRTLWDECNFQRVRHTSPVMQNLDSDSGLVGNSTELEPCVVINLCDANPAENMLRTTNIYARRLNSKESFSIEEARPESLDELLSAFEQLHERRWHAKGFSGVLAEERDRNFHREVASGFLRAGRLVLYAMRIDDRIVSVIYGFHHRNRTYSYLSGFDPEYRRQSVGTIMIGHAVQQALQQRRSFDFLKGQEPYKYRWGAHDEPVFGRTLRKSH
jgi:CelD/BcsL family acetyltransferase involved in cellulose biosynthesis